MKKTFIILSSLLFLLFSLTFTTSVSAQSENQKTDDSKKHQIRLGIGPDGYWIDNMAKGDGGLVINFAFGDGRGRVQKLFTFNSSIDGHYLGGGYQADVVFFKSFHIGSGITLNRWVDTTKLPDGVAIEDVTSPLTRSAILIQDQGSYKLLKWQDTTLVPYLDFGFSGDIDENNNGIYFTYRLGWVIWSRNPYSNDGKSPFRRYGSWLFGYRKSF